MKIAGTDDRLDPPPQNAGGVSDADVQHVAGLGAQFAALVQQCEQGIGTADSAVERGTDLVTTVGRGFDALSGLLLRAGASQQAAGGTPGNVRRALAETFTQALLLPADERSLAGRSLFEGLARQLGLR